MAKKAQPQRIRLAELLVARGLCAGVEEARRVVWSGEVIVDGDMVDQPAALVPDTAELRLRRRRRYATRGGEKLEPALAAFGVEVRGRCALDVGAAGGGFTDCLLAHGASRVYAVDVGRGQLAQRLRLDARVVDLGGHDVMALTPSDLVPPPSLAVVDVTFRSLSDMLPKVLSLLDEPREAVALVKPLHEARLAGMGRVPDLQRAVFTWLLPRLSESQIGVSDIIASACPPQAGSLEFFLHIKAPGHSAAELWERAEAALVAGAAVLSRRAKPKRSGQKRRRTWRRFGQRK